MKKIACSLFLALLGWGMVVAQPADSMEARPVNPYRLGRWLVGLNGAISASNTNQGFGQTDTINFNNSHQINFRAGYFVLDRLPVGVSVNTLRSNSRDQFNRNQETFTVGPWARYYLDADAASLYPELSFFYTRYLEQSELAANNQPIINQILEADGVGFGLGLGFAYTVLDLMVFDVGLHYNQFFLDGRLDDRIESTSSERGFSRTQITFTFGFNVLIRK